MDSIPDGKKRVLVVDDEDDVTFLFQQYFRHQIRAGEVEFGFAGSGEEALSQLGRLGPDVVLILCDIRMPGMDGFELLEAIRNQWPPVPVYLVTAYNIQAYRERAMELGANGYLTKPVDFNELSKLVFPQAAESGPDSDGAGSVPGA